MIYKLCLFHSLAATIQNTFPSQYARITAKTCFEIERVIGIGTYERDRE